MRWLRWSIEDRALGAPRSPVAPSASGELPQSREERRILGFGTGDLDSGHKVGGRRAGRSWIARQEAEQSVECLGG